MRSYYSPGKAVEAVQFTGDNLKQIEQIFGEKCVGARFRGHQCITTTIDTKDGWAKADVGDFIVKSEDGIFVYKEKDFKKNFMDVKFKMLECKVCGAEFRPTEEAHYIARDNNKTGAVAVISKDEEKIYDAFDCPVCGSQIIVKERRRIFIPDQIEEYTEDSDDKFGECENENK